MLDCYGYLQQSIRAPYDVLYRTENTDSTPDIPLKTTVRRVMLPEGVHMIFTMFDDEEEA